MTGEKRTAARLLRLASPGSVDMEAFLGALSESHADEGVRWHAQDGLDHRTWEGRGPLPGDPRDAGQPPEASKGPHKD